MAMKLIVLPEAIEQQQDIQAEIMKSNDYDELVAIRDFLRLVTYLKQSGWIVADEGEAAKTPRPPYPIEVW